MKEACAMVEEKSQTKYVVVQEGILRWIEAGTISAGDRLPIEDELASTFGVSRQTVRHAVGELVRQGLLERRQGSGTYYTGQTARGQERLATGRVIAVVCTYLSDYIFPHIIQGIEETLSQEGYSFLLYSTQNDMEKERRALEDILDKQVAAVICEPTKSAFPNTNLDLYQRLQDARVPVVMIHANYAGIACPTLEVDDRMGAFMAVEHLIAEGHQRVGAIVKMDDRQGLRRLEGVMQACLSHQVVVPTESLMLYSTEQLPFVIDQYIERLQSLEGTDRPTAVFCYNDQIASQFIQAARAQGISVPEDIALTGFDDSALALHAFPQLTSIVHPKKDMGIKAATWVVEWVQNGLIPPPLYRFTPSLVVRGSSKAQPVEVV